MTVHLKQLVQDYLSVHGTMTVNELDALIFASYSESALLREASTQHVASAKSYKAGNEINDEQRLSLLMKGVKLKRNQFFFRCKKSNRQWLARKGDTLWMANIGETRVA
jgi:hypothetical protein